MIEVYRFGVDRVRVIVDGDGDMLDEQLASFVKTSMQHGLLDEHVERAIEVLGLKEAQ